jgi:hypothetical protein
MSKAEEQSELELSNLSDEEREALEGEDMRSAADVEKDAAAAEAIRDDDPDKAAATPAADAAPATPAADTPAAEEAADAQPAMPRLSAPQIEGYQEAVSTLLDQRKAIREQYRNGDIVAEEKDRLEDEINDKITDLRSDQKLAQYTETNNRQMEERDYLRTIDVVKADIKAREGIDYDANPGLMQTWDFRVRALASDPANANRDGQWFLWEAHRQTKAEAEATARALGFKREDAGGKPPVNPVAEALQKRRPPETRAKSLAALPAASQDTGHEGAEFSHLDRLNGDDLEMAVARMTPDQQERWARQ